MTRSFSSRLFLRQSALLLALTTGAVVAMAHGDVTPPVCGHQRTARAG